VAMPEFKALKEKMKEAPPSESKGGAKPEETKQEKTDKQKTSKP